MAVTPFRIAVPDAEVDALRAALGRTRWPDQIDGRGLGLRHRARIPAGAGGLLGRRLPTGTRARRCSTRSRNTALRSMRPVSSASVCTSCTSRASDRHRCHCVLSHGWPSTHFEYHDVVARLANPGAFGDDPARRVPRGRAITAGLRLLRHPATTRHDAKRDGDDVRRVDARARLRALRGRGLRLGRVRDRAPRPRPCRCGRRDPHGHAQLPGARLPTRPPRTPRTARARRPGRRDESGYSTIQGTKPQSLAYGLMDSPAGLAGWIVEKWRRWSDCGGRRPTSVHPRRAPHDRRHLLVHRHDQQRQSPVLREPPRSGPARRR